MTDLHSSTLSNIEFVNCKILGVKFNLCNDFIFDVRFSNCILDYSSFAKRKMAKTQFINSSLKGVDFGEANLKQAQFTDCDLHETIFYHSNLQGADFTSARSYIIDINENTVKKARFSKDDLAGLLQQFGIVIE